MNVDEAARQLAPAAALGEGIEAVAEGAVDQARHHREIDALRAEPLHHRRRADGRWHRLDRVAVGLDDPGVGEGREDQVDRHDVTRRLEQPGLLLLSVLQELEDAPLEGVALDHVRLASGPDHRPVSAAERRRRQRHALHREIRAQLVDRGELRLDVGPELLLALAHREARGEVLARRGNRMQRVGRARAPQVGIEPEELEGDRRAGPGRARDEDRRLDRLARDARIRVPDARELEPGAQAAEELLPGHEPTDDGQRLGIEGLDQRAEAPLPVRIAEVAEGSPAEARTGLLEQGIGVERDHPPRTGLPAADRVAHRVDAPDPIGSRVPRGHRRHALDLRLSHLDSSCGPSARGGDAGRTLQCGARIEHVNPGEGSGRKEPRRWAC